jgi:hypothetical protein
MRFSLTIGVPPMVKELSVNIWLMQVSLTGLFAT